MQKEITVGVFAAFWGQHLVSTQSSHQGLCLKDKYRYDSGAFEEVPPSQPTLQQQAPSGMAGPEKQMSSPCFSDTEFAAHLEEILSTAEDDTPLLPPPFK